MTNTQTEQSPHGNAAHAYQQAKQHSMNPVDIVVALYEGILKNLEEAKIAYQQENLEKMCQLNQKTFRIIAALQYHLDFEKGGDTAPALDNFYKIVFVKLAKILESNDPVKEYEHLQSNIKDIYVKWSKLAKKIEKQQRNF